MISPKTPEGWATKMAKNSSYWKMPDEEFANEVHDLLVEKYGNTLTSDQLTDVIQSAIQQRKELTEC